VEVPEHFNVTLDRVISVRSSFPRKLAAAGQAVDKAPDDRYHFFRYCPGRVRKALKPLMKTDALDFNSIKNATPKSGRDRVRQTGLRNIFKVLNVYEPSAELLAAPDVVPPPPPMELEYTVEVTTDSVVEAFIATTVLITNHPAFVLIAQMCRVGTMPENPIWQLCQSRLTQRFSLRTA
jgi:hypothetical protein